MFYLKNKSNKCIVYLCSSLGLAVAPRVRFLQRKAVLENPKKKKGQQNDNQDDDDDDIKLEPKSESDVDVSDMEEEEKKEKVKKVKPEEKKNVAKNETGFKSSGAKTLDFSLPGENNYQQLHSKIWT